MRLLEPLPFARATASNRVLFGPHVTNLGDSARRFSARHTAYYARRSAGGCGIIVTEGASVHASYWPYERAPLAERCADGWSAIVEACPGSLVIASLDHAGGQGSSAYSQLPLWAPSRVPEVNTREVPKWMEADDIAAVVDGFGAAAAIAVGAGCHGVEINAGQHSLVRQFLSGLTNQRGDEWGTDRLLFARQVIEQVRAAVGDAIVGLRLSCDELAPWAGITPEHAPTLAAELCAVGIDYLVVVRGAIFSVEKTRPDFHEPPGFNRDLARSVRVTVTDHVAVVLQGSVIDPAMAEEAIETGVCDAVEMTRAQIADPDLVRKVARGEIDRIRPCSLSNQVDQVRDPRNPIVTSEAEPTSGHELDDPDWYAPTAHPRDVVVVGGGPAGLEAARVAAMRGHRVRLVEQSDRLGGAAAIAGPHHRLVEWLIRECQLAGVRMDLGTSWQPSGDTAPPGGPVVIQATGGRRGEPSYDIKDDALVLDVLDVWRAGIDALPHGDIALLDPIGGPIAIALAEAIGGRTILITPDQIAGNELARTGDLAPCNTRLAQRGVRIERRTIIRSVAPAAGGNGLELVLEHRFTGEQRTLAVAAVVDCGFRLPTDPLPGADIQIGDCVAPRTVLEAILEGRRAALQIDSL